MADPIYVVTLKDRDDLDGFYADMKSDGYKISLKRPISRNTHYHMTDLQAENLRGDSRVMAVEKRPEDLGMVKKPSAYYNNAVHVHNGDFRKSGTFQPLDRDWGKLHSGGTDAQRKKNTWGWNGNHTTNDNLEIFNDGRHVDVVICDNTVSFDCHEWHSLSSGVSRFVQYDWYAQLNGFVSSIDDDSITLPSGGYGNYVDNAANTSNHGTHCAGTIAGRYYGWAPEANIYALQVLSGHSGTVEVPNLLEFDYLRAFHRYKAINPETGRRNATVTSHSWGFGYDYSEDFPLGFSIQDIGAIVYRGTTYNSSNPGPSGWSMEGIQADFGFSYTHTEIPSHYVAMAEDAKDAVEDGIIVIAAASNDNLMAVPQIDPTTGATHQDWNNSVNLSGIGSRYYNRGSAPSSGEGVICVGSISTDQDFRRSSFSNYGPLVDVWAPGSQIVSATNSVGTPDTKYGGDNWFQTKSGTSMATPQVSGIAAILAGNKWRYTNKDILGLIQQNSKLNDLTVDLPRSAAGQVERIVAVEGPSSSYYAVYGFTIDGYYYTPGPNTAQNTTIRCWVGDKVSFYLGYDGQFNNTGAITNHPFYIKTANTTGTGNLVSSGTITGTQGATSGTLSWDTTGVTPGTYYYQCGNHLAMYGKIEVLVEPGAVAAAGSFISDTCFKGAPNRYVLGTNVRPTSGVIDGWYGQTLKADRNTSKPYANRQIFPRQNSLHRGIPGPLTYTLAVQGPNMNDYTMTGHDRNSAYTNKANPTLTFKKGDTINFEMDASGHPMWISLLQSTGQPSAGNIPPGVVNNGTESGATITWDTTTVTPGTYYYNCQHHTNMWGTIFVNA